MFSGRLTTGVKKQLLELMFLPPTPSDGGARPRRSGSGSAAPAGPAAGGGRPRRAGAGGGRGVRGQRWGVLPAVGVCFPPSPFSRSLAGAGTAPHRRRGLTPAADRCPERAAGHPARPPPDPAPRPQVRGGRCPPPRAGLPARCRGSAHPAGRRVLRGLSSLTPAALPQRGPRTARRPLWP